MISFLSAPNSPPRNLDVLSKTSTELELSWDAPPMTHWNSERLGYKVGYRYVDLNPGNFNSY